MSAAVHGEPVGPEERAPSYAEQLLAGIPVSQRRLSLDGIATGVLEGGAGTTIVLLHGPGEFAAKWLRVLPDLLRTHRVLAPDLPGHGVSGLPERPLDADGVLSWLRELIERTCPAPPVLVGHVLGGAIAARFAIRHSRLLGRLVLVDSLGLAPFRPAPLFALRMGFFLAHPTMGTFERFMRQCSFDLDGLRDQLGERWPPFAAYNLALARGPQARAASRLMRLLGVPLIPAADLARIAIPTGLIWGRQDRAIRLRVAEDASARFGWPLHVIEGCADDPARDQPEAFLKALRAEIGA